MKTARDLSLTMLLVLMTAACGDASIGITFICRRSKQESLAPFLYLQVMAPWRQRP